MLEIALKGQLDELVHKGLSIEQLGSNAVLREHDLACLWKLEVHQCCS
jgi:hypothetical protein